MSDTEVTDLNKLDRDELIAFATEHDLTINADGTQDEILKELADGNLPSGTAVSTPVDLATVDELTEEDLKGLKKPELVDLAKKRNIAHTSTSKVDELVANLIGNVTVPESGEKPERIEAGAKALYEHANPDGIGWDNVQSGVRDRYLGFSEVVHGA